MEAGDGALTLIRSPCPVRGCPPLASLTAMRVSKIGGFRPERNSGTLQLMNTGGPARHLEISGIRRKR